MKTKLVFMLIMVTSVMVACKKEKQSEVTPNQKIEVKSSSMRTANQGQLQDSEIPIAVKQTLLIQYPAVNQVKWFLDSIGNYIGNFKYIDKINYSVKIRISGGIIYTVFDVDMSSLPIAIISYLSTNYPNVHPYSTKKSIDEKGVVTYLVEIKNNTEPLVFDANGSIIQ